MMNGRQTQELFSTGSGLDIQLPPVVDNFNPALFSSSQSFFDTSINGNPQSYSNPATILVHQMVQQLHAYVKDNQELKRSIKSYNEELEKRFKELETWKNTQRKEKMQLKEKFDEAYKASTCLKNEIALLKGENIKLELRLTSEKSNSTSVGNKDCVKSDNENLSSCLANVHVADDIQIKYFSTVENLERQLKDAISRNENGNLIQEKLHAANRSLQQRLNEQQTQLGELDTLRKNNRSLEISCQQLLNERNTANEQKFISEKSNKEVKQQLVQMINDVSAYRTENENLHSELQQSKSDENELRTQNRQLQDKLHKLKQEFQNHQADKKQEIANLEKKIAEKNRSLDELYADYEKYRKENDKLTVDRDTILARFFAAEESLANKDRELRDQRENYIRLDAQLQDEKKKLIDDVTFFKAQADVYKQDFLQEREDRVKTHEVNEQLRARLETLQSRLDQYPNN